MLARGGVALNRSKVVRASGASGINGVAGRRNRVCGRWSRNTSPHWGAPSIRPPGRAQLRLHFWCVHLERFCRAAGGTRVLGAERRNGGDSSAVVRLRCVSPGVEARTTRAATRPPSFFLRPCPLPRKARGRISHAGRLRGRPAGDCGGLPRRASTVARPIYFAPDFTNPHLVSSRVFAWMWSAGGLFGSRARRPSAMP